MNSEIASRIGWLNGVIVFLLTFLVLSCGSPDRQTVDEAGKTFKKFEDEFLDAYWQQYPSYAIFVGYGKYYDRLNIPDSSLYAGHIDFSRNWTDSLHQINFGKLSDNDKISYRIIENQLAVDIWYQSVFKQQEWDASLYNLGAECDYIINQPYAPLAERLRLLGKHLEKADAYYAGALKMLKNPTREHLLLAVRQNRGGLSVFGESLEDSIAVSSLTADEKTRIKNNIAGTMKAIKSFIGNLQRMAADKGQSFRSFRIGKELFTQKFRYDLGTDLSPEDIYNQALSDKKMYHRKMAILANELWPQYYGSVERPADTVTLIQDVMDKIQLKHAIPANFFDSLVSQVEQLKRFIIARNLFDLDTTAHPIIVRLMPPYLSGFAIANAEFTPPYQQQGATYFNIDDITGYDPGRAESTLREYNDYSSQFLSIHEAVPGHCVQGIYNKIHSPDVVRSVFTNGAMIEGWAVYTEDMMVENGWGNHAPELELMLYKLKLRELANVLIDYDLQCLNSCREEIMDILIRECFQTKAQAEEKYHRATVSQVQLCSYYTGAKAIHALRDEYREKMGSQYSLLDFHEKFLSCGSAPVKYIREMMMK